MMRSDRDFATKMITGGAGNRFRFKISDAAHAMSTRGSRLERSLGVLIVPISIGLWAGIALIARLAWVALS
jgi:hypothetical protein